MRRGIINEGPSIEPVKRPNPNATRKWRKVRRAIQKGVTGPPNEEANNSSLCIIPPTTLLSLNMHAKLKTRNTPYVTLDPSLPTAILNSIVSLLEDRNVSRVKGRDTKALQGILTTEAQRIGIDPAKISELVSKVEIACAVKACADTAPFTLILKSAQTSIDQLDLHNNGNYLNISKYNGDTGRMETNPFFTLEPNGFCANFKGIGLKSVQHKWFSMVPLAFPKGQFGDKEANVLSKSGIGSALSLSANALAISANQTSILLLFKDIMDIYAHFKHSFLDSDILSEYSDVCQSILEGNIVIDILSAKRMIESFGLYITFEADVLYLCIDKSSDKTVRHRVPFSNKVWFTDQQLFDLLFENILPQEVRKLNHKEKFDTWKTKMLRIRTTANTMDLNHGLFTSLLVYTGVFISTHADVINHHNCFNIVSTYFSGHDLKFLENIRALQTASTHYREEMYDRPKDEKRPVQQLMGQTVAMNNAKVAQLFTRTRPYETRQSTNIFNFENKTRIQWFTDTGHLHTAPHNATTEILPICLVVSDLTVHNAGANSVYCFNPWETRSTSSNFVLSFERDAIIVVECGNYFTYRCEIDEETVELKRIIVGEAHCENFLTSIFGPITADNVKEFCEAVIVKFKEKQLELEEESTQYKLGTICSTFNIDAIDIANRFKKHIADIARELYCALQTDKDFQDFIDSVRKKRDDLSLAFLKKALAGFAGFNPKKPILDRAEAEAEADAEAGAETEP